MQPVLLALVIGCALQQHLDALAVSWDQAQVRRVVRGAGTYPSTPAQNRADRSRSEKSITIRGSPLVRPWLRGQRSVRCPAPRLSGRGH
jgi:hypothetical protein